MKQAGRDTIYVGRHILYQVGILYKPAEMSPGQRRKHRRSVAQLFKPVGMLYKPRRQCIQRHGYYPSNGRQIIMYIYRKCKERGFC